MPATESESRSEARWQDAYEEHRVAVAAYVDTAERLSDDAWNQPWAPGKWTPAEVTEHLCRVYEVILAELATGQGMQRRLGRWRERLTRWIVLPHILSHGTFPLRVPAPREVRPTEVRGGRAELLRQFRALSERLEGELDRARLTRSFVLTHAFFGPMPPLKMVRLGAIHVEHHRRQIAPKR
ncbi:MAG TPA: DinB family protein [Longimicrobiaceae bacterium]|nr:DinB family protein [Longimicrobiaceae bacterium]